MFIMMMYLLQQIQAVQYQSHSVLLYDECCVVFEQQNHCTVGISVRNIYLSLTTSVTLFKHQLLSFKYVRWYF